MAQAHPLPLHHPWGSGVANYDITAYCQSIFSNKGYLLPSSFNYFQMIFLIFSTLRPSCSIKILNTFPHSYNFKKLLYHNDIHISRKWYLEMEVKT